MAPFTLGSGIGSSSSSSIPRSKRRRSHHISMGTWIDSAMLKPCKTCLCVPLNMSCTTCMYVACPFSCSLSFFIFCSWVTPYLWLHHAFLPCQAAPHLAHNFFTLCEMIFISPRVRATTSRHTTLV